MVEILSLTTKVRANEKLITNRFKASTSRKMRSKRLYMVFSNLTRNPSLRDINIKTDLSITESGSEVSDMAEVR